MLLSSRLSFISLNSRGLKDITKRKALFLFCKEQKAQVIFLQETHSSNNDMVFWKNQWGDTILFSHGSNRSAGTAICFNNCPGQIIEYKSDLKGHWIIVILNIEGCFWIVCNIYGYNTDTDNRLLLEDITKMIRIFKMQYPTDNIVVGGDFNCVPDEWMDRLPTKFTSHTYSQLLSNFCSNNALYDAWRHLNPNTRQFSWIRPNCSNKSRIDLWLVSPNVLNHISKADISTAPVTDHCVVSINLIPSLRNTERRSYWKFNAEYLKDDQYCSIIKKLLLSVKENMSLDSAGRKWEIFKYEVRKYSIQYGKERGKKIKEAEQQLVSDLNKFYRNYNVSDTDKEEFLRLQSKLDSFYLNRARGAFIRSRAKWIEEGEKNSSYFCKLEKARQTKNAINSLYVDGNLISDPKEISQNIYTFYQNLYSSHFSDLESKHFFKTIETFIPKINSKFKKECDSEIKMSELDSAVQKLALGKSPGQDGLTSNFYKFFWEDIKDLLFNALKECIQNNTLLTTMKQGVITLIPKPNKDKSVIENLRPITLLNVDYKLFTHVLANRLKNGIQNVVSETQSGFLPNRLIHNNIRLVLDLLDYSKLIEDDGIILFLDFFKAFDSLEHQFILMSLQHFGFGKKFIDTISMLYKDITSAVLLPSGTTSRFPVNRGIRQGDPVSPLLFILATEMLTLSVQNDQTIKPLSVAGNPLKIIQLADDTALLLKQKEEIQNAMKTLSLFSQASGLKLNKNKCEIMTIHETKETHMYNIPVKNEIKYLGIMIHRNFKDRLNTNIQSIIGKNQKILNSWLQRNISIFGRILLTKMESISRLIYPAFAVALPDSCIKNINKIQYDFIWNNKQHLIRKNDIVKPIEEGGMNVIDFEVMNGVIKLQWLKNFIKNKHSHWFSIPSYLFQKVGGIEFLLKCDFDPMKLPIKLSEFHKQVLLYWKLIYTHNFSPHTSSIWNNRFVLYKRKSLFHQTWMDKGIWSIVQLMKNDGTFLNHTEFKTKFQLDCTNKEYSRVIKSISPKLIQLIKPNVQHSLILPQLPSLCIDSGLFSDIKCNNKFLRASLTNKLFPLPIRRKTLSPFFFKK
uniref:Reverse transcriptase domain-containing protein n=1 Tax=Oryzias melastigma TaxID=30732 RepID=A0A3B3DY82_ORYME